MTTLPPPSHRPTAAPDRSPTAQRRRVHGPARPALGRSNGQPSGRSSGRSLRRLVPAVVLVAVAAAVAACTSSSSTATGSSATTGRGAGAGGAGATVPAADPVAALPALQVTATEHADGAAMAYGFDGPSSVPAGKVLVEVRNDGKEEHQAAVARLAPGVTYDQLEAAIATNPNAALPLVEVVGGPAGVAPGATGKGIVELTPGQYVLYCFVADAQGTPHLAHGMHRRLEVTGGAASTTAGSAGASSSIPTAGTVTLQDFGILLPDGFGGKGWYEVVNDGPQPHEAVIYKAAPGHTSAELSAYLAKVGAALSGTGPMPTDPFPGVPAGGVSAAAKGSDQWIWLDLDPSGQHLFLCGIPDTTKGFIPHFMEGMTTTWPSS